MAKITFKSRTARVCLGTSNPDNAAPKGIGSRAEPVTGAVQVCFDGA